MEKFSYEANGYNRSEVNKFVEDVIVETEDIVNRVKTQQKEIEDLKKELAHYKEIESSLKQALAIKQETTEKEVNMIINNAKQNASRIINDALLRADKLDNSSKSLKNNITNLKNGLKSSVVQQQAVIDEIEILEQED